MKKQAQKWQETSPRSRGFQVVNTKTKPNMPDSKTLKIISCAISIWESTTLNPDNARTTRSYGLESVYVMTHTLLHCHTPVTQATTLLPNNSVNSDLLVPKHVKWTEPAAQMY